MISERGLVEDLLCSSVRILLRKQVRRVQEVGIQEDGD